MESIVGIICEYDPFHLGHRRQFELIRQQLPGARIVCLISGCFTQRGMPAVHAPAVRAKAALEAGADVVMELPALFAVRDAEHFALGAVEIFTKLGFVTHLSFGAEDDASALLPAARLLEKPSAAFEQALHAALDEGLSFAAAQGRALSACFPENSALWDKPNNILALCYLRAIIRLNSSLIPLPVRRESDYHAAMLSSNEWPSASAVRRAFWADQLNEASASCGWQLPRSPVCRPDALDSLLLYKLRTSPAQELARLPDCTEGLENRLKACVQQAVSREELMTLLKTRRYAHARLSRLCTHALLGVTQSMLKENSRPQYVRLLGLGKQAASLTPLFKTSAITVLAKAADGDRSSVQYQLDLAAYDLWALGAGLPAGLMLRQGVVIV